MNKLRLINHFGKTAKSIETLSELTGKSTAWLVIAMVLLVGYDVSMRYFFFRSGSVGLQEMEWHLFSLIFLLGAAYTLKHNEHVRLDLFYKSHFITDNHRAWINLLGSLLFLMPFCLLIIFISIPFVEQSLACAEASPNPGGLPHRWLLKSAIPLGFALLVLQGIADLLNNLIKILENTK